MKVRCFQLFPKLTSLRFGRISLDLGLTAFDGRDYERIGLRAQGMVSVYVW